MTVGKNKSLTENKTGKGLFFTNTKTVEFIKFSLLSYFSPKGEYKMSSLKDAYCTPTYVSGWDSREEGETHLQEQC